MQEANERSERDAFGGAGLGRCSCGAAGASRLRGLPRPLLAGGLRRRSAAKHRKPRCFCPLQASESAAALVRLPASSSANVPGHSALTARRHASTPTVAQGNPGKRPLRVHPCSARRAIAPQAELRGSRSDRSPRLACLSVSSLPFACKVDTTDSLEPRSRKDTHFSLSFTSSTCCGRLGRAQTRT